MDSTFTALPAYAELFCFSNFTFLHGASHAEELVERAAQLGYAGLAVTDECSLAGVVRAHVAAEKAELPLVIGSYFRLRNADAARAESRGLRQFVGVDYARANPRAEG
jgi:error-prone DNA polymerase